MTRARYVVWAAFDALILADCARIPVGMRREARARRYAARPWDELVKLNALCGPGIAR